MSGMLTPPEPVLTGPDDPPGETGPPPAAADFESLLGQVVESAYRTAYRMSGNQQDAEDLVQEAALNAFRAFHTFQPGTNFKAWFFRILTNCFCTSRRKRRQLVSMDDAEDGHPIYLYLRTAEVGLHGGAEDPAKRLLDRLAAEDIARALDSLPEEFRVVSVLYFMENFSYQEIAAVLDVPIGTVRSRLHRGRRMLQKQLWRLAVDQGLVAEPARAQPMS